MAWIFLTLTAAIGLYFGFKIGLGLLPLGLLGLVIIYFYTERITRFPFLCLIAPGLGFGPLMVMGTGFVLSGGYSWTAFVASLVPFFLVSNLLLLNQFPDVEADQSKGRKHYPIQIGKQNSRVIYNSFLILPFIVIMIGAAVGLFPLSSLIGLLGLLVAVPIIRGVAADVEDTEKLIPILGQNVIINLVTPILFAVGLLIDWPG